MNSNKSMTATMRNMMERTKEAAGPVRDRFIWSEPQSRRRTDYGQFADILDSQPDGINLYLDTCFITSHEIPAFFWDAVLRKRIVFTPMIWDELQHWYANPRRNAYFRDAIAKARFNRNPRVRFADYSEYKGADLAFAWAIRFYTGLLATRKHEARWLVDHFVRTMDREPTPQERARLFQEAGNERGQRLRIKGYEAIGSRNFYSDEELVAFAVIDSLAKSTACLLLTRDTDILDQYYKLTVLTYFHYNDMLFGEYYYYSKPKALLIPMPDTPETRHFFNVRESFLVPKPDGHPDILFPKARHPIHMTCVLFGGADDTLAFTPMWYIGDIDQIRICYARMLSMGLSTHLLDGMNCHAGTTPVGIDFRRYAMATEDKFLHCGDLKLCMLDVDQAVHYTEKPIAVYVHNSDLQ